MSVSSPTPSSSTKPLLSDGIYNKLKKTATIVLPAVAALYIALAQIWHFPDVEKVVGTITAVNTFAGVLIQFSKKSYYASGAQYDGVMNVTPNGARTTASLELNSHPADIVNKDAVTFKVNADTGETPIVDPTTRP